MNSESHVTRRDFIRATSGLAGVVMAGLPLDITKTKPLLSFSTLGCPGWSFEKILKYAADYGYDGIEIRGVLDQMDLPKCPEFSTPERISTTKKMVAEKGLKIIDLGSSANMHIADPVKRKASLDEARRFIDLAAQLKCPYIRVFPNDLPENQDRNETIQLIIKGLIELGNYAKGTGVTVLMESHGKVIGKDILFQIMQATENPQVGLIWDVVNMWSVTKESPTEVYQKLKKYIRHTHIKDMKMVDGKERYVQIGQGEAPLKEAISELVKGGYKGYYSFEWEKRWHAEIEEPEIVIPEYPKAMKKYF